MENNNIPEDVKKYYEELSEECEKELDGFDVWDLYRDNGKPVIERFFQKMYRLRKKRVSFLEKRVEKFIEDGRGDKKARRSQGLRYLYEYLDYCYKYVSTIAIQAVHILKEDKEAKSVLTYYLDIRRRALAEYLEEDRNYVKGLANGQYIVNERIVYLLDRQKTLESMDLDAEFERVKTFKLKEKEEKAKGTNLVYATIAWVIASLGEAYSYGTAFLIRFGLLSEIVSLIQEIQDLALKISEKVGLMSPDIPGELDFELIQYYSAPELTLLDKVRESLSQYQDEIDQKYLLDDEY